MRRVHLKRLAVYWYMCVGRSVQMFFYRYWYCERIPTRMMMNLDVTLYF